MGTSLSPFIDALPDDIDKKEILKVVAGEIDRQIYSNYQLWPTNYIAHDMLNDGPGNILRSIRLKKKTALLRI